VRILRVTLSRLAVGGIALGLVVLVACGGDDNGGGSGNSGVQPTNCPSPCTVGTVCYQPAPNANCNGTWYCWSDQKWYCAPEESGGPSDATITFEAAAPEAGDEAGDDASTSASDGEAGAGGG
jgi:hypothetical protein